MVGFFLDWNLAMSKAAPATASVLPIAPAAKSAATPLDPRILFSGICLLALVVAIVFGQPGIWM
jgi:hypothetical protein